MSSWTKKPVTWILSIIAYGNKNNSALLLFEPTVVTRVPMWRVMPLNIILRQ